MPRAQFNADIRACVRERDTRVNPDFRTLLTPLGSGAFQPLRIGTTTVSIQASPAHASSPACITAPEEVDTWEVALFTAQGAWASPTSHPDLFRMDLWGQYWAADPTTRNPVGRYVPTEVVQVLTDFLAYGPERWAVLTGQGTINPRQRTS